MSEQENNYNWNYNEFCTYLLIYAAYADLEFSKPEKEAILKNIDQEHFDKIESVYLESSDFHRLQIIIDHKGLYYPTLSQKEELLQKMKALFEADGEYSYLEKNLLLFLTKLL